MSLYRLNETLFWDFTERDHLHGYDWFAKAVVTPVGYMIEAMRPLAEDERAWWEKAFSYLRTAKHAFVPLESEDP